MIYAAHVSPGEFLIDDDQLPVSESTLLILCYTRQVAFSAQRNRQDSAGLQDPVHFKQPRSLHAFRQMSEYRDGVAEVKKFRLIRQRGLKLVHGK